MQICYQFKWYYFSGVNCEVGPDFCYSNPCSNGGTCLSGNQDYTCQCPLGYLGKGARELLSLDVDLSSLITLATIVFSILKITSGFELFLRNRPLVTPNMPVTKN